MKKKKFQFNNIYFVFFFAGMGEKWRKKIVK